MFANQLEQKTGIAYGNPEASFSDIVRAARAAKAHEFILDKEEGYDTMLGEGGSDLSGGETQRVAIARAISRWLIAVANLIMTMPLPFS